MDTVLSLLSPFVWVLFCAIGALGVRLRFTAWPQSILVASLVGAMTAFFGGNAALQIGSSILTALFTFITLDLCSLNSSRSLKAPEPPASAAPKPAAPQKTTSAEAPTSARPGDNKASTERHQAANAGSRPGGATWPRGSRPVEQRRASASSQPSQTGRRAKTQGASSAEGPVEIILPAERAVLRRKSALKGYWIATTTEGEKEVYMPPGAQAYPGRPISIVVKPNGTHMGVPLPAR